MIVQCVHVLGLFVIDQTLKLGAWVLLLQSAQICNRNRLWWEINSSCQHGLDAGNLFFLIKLIVARHKRLKLIGHTLGSDGQHGQQILILPMLVDGGNKCLDKPGTVGGVSPAVIAGYGGKSDQKIGPAWNAEKGRISAVFHVIESDSHALVQLISLTRLYQKDLGLASKTLTIITCKI